ncbi:MAG: hypothetical protein IPP13_10865 [Kouleothrix sp.]|nr:hypothetical protein [Kouleothrix sp.]
MATLLVVLCFAFAEPLACIIHCQLDPGQPPDAQPLYAHHHAGAAPQPAATGAVLIASTSPWCFYATSRPDIPQAPVPRSPVHELVVPAVLALVVPAPLAFIFRPGPLHRVPPIRAPSTPPPKQ